MSVLKCIGNRRTPAGLPLLLALLLAVAPAAASDPAVAHTPTLTDAWLQLLASGHGTIPWGFAFALREDTANALPPRQQRLVRELDSLILSARLQGDAASTRTLRGWQATLALEPPGLLRTPGRMDLPWLGAHLRQDVPLAKLHHWGYCQVPDWVEVWSHAGVVRQPWSPGLTVAALLQQLPVASYRRADYARVLSATGTERRVGIAAWNQEPAPLGPGSRVLLELPEPQTPLPFAGRETGTVTLAWLHRELAAVLAAQLPGDDCEVFQQP